MAELKATVQRTPKGLITGFVNILKADTKFDAAGVYKFKAKFEKTSAIEKICKQMETEQQKAFDAWKKDPKNKGKKPIKMGDLPFFEDEDGNIVISFKSKASYVNKDGDTVHRVIPIFGADAKRIDPEEIKPFGEGSEVKVAFIMNSFANAAAGASVTLRIDSIQLIKAKGFSGGSGGWDAEDAPDEDQEDTPWTDDEGGSSGDAQDDDF